MQFCKPHWDALIAGVKARGLWKFVPETGKEAHENAVLELQGHGTTFDPLMGSMWQLSSAVMSNIEKCDGPLAAIQAFGDPEWCPMCTVQRSYECWDDPKWKAEYGERPAHARDAQGWIDGMLDMALRYAKEQKMPIGEPE